MKYKDLLNEVGDYTAVYLNLCLEQDITWNVIGVLSNIIKCDTFGVKVSLRSLEKHCNLARHTIISSIGILREKGLIKPEKVGFSVNYERLMNLAEQCNLKSKEITKASKSGAKIAPPYKENKPSSGAEIAPSYKQSVPSNGAKIAPQGGAEIAPITDNNNINNTVSVINPKTLNKEVNNTVSVINKNVELKVLGEEKEKRTLKEDNRCMVVNSVSSSSVGGSESAGNNTSSAEGVNKLRSQVESAKQELLVELKGLIAGTSFDDADNEGVKLIDEYRERIVNYAKRPNCGKDKFELLEGYFAESAEIYDNFKKENGKKFSGEFVCSYRRNGNLRLEIQRAA